MRVIVSLDHRLAYSDPPTAAVMAAAAIVFFAFYGFDAVATTAEETKNPKRDLTIGIIGSMLVCTVIYMAVAITAVGALPFVQLASSPEPLALVLVLRQLSHPFAAQLIALAAVIALPSVILVMMYGQSRIFFVMVRDGLLPRRLATVSPRSGGPTMTTLLTGLTIAAVAGFFPARRDCRVGECGHLDRIHLGGCLPYRAAPDRAGHAAPVPLPSSVSGGSTDDRRMPVPSRQPADGDADTLRDLEYRRIGHLLRLRTAKERRGTF